MGKHNIAVGFRELVRVAVALVAVGFSCSCNQPSSTSGGASTATVIPGGTAGVVGTSTGSSGATTTSTSNVNALQIITKGDPSGSFDPVAVPLAGGVAVKATRLYNLDGTQITTGNIPNWFIEGRAFLTSTRTTAGAPTNTNGDTPCAYFDLFNDNNPENTGFYTVDGYNPTAAITGVDVDQCAGVAGAEQSQIGMYFRIDRRFMNPTDRLQVIVKAKPIDAPTTAPSASSCVVGGYFDASACSNQLFTLTMRTSPGAAAKPFYILFPSAKALDLLSESVLVPINIDQSISTISIDRVKGGSVFYGISIIRLQ